MVPLDRFVLCLCSGLFLAPLPLYGACRLPIPDGGDEGYVPSKDNLFGNVVQVALPFVTVRNGRSKKLSRFRFQESVRFTASTAVMGLFQISSPDCKSGFGTKIANDLQREFPLSPTFRSSRMTQQIEQSSITKVELFRYIVARLAMINSHITHHFIGPANNAALSGEFKR